MKMELRKINKEVAIALLENNQGNRKINPTHLEFLKSEIKNGRFRQNGDTIRISKSGRLLDGQHRLTAIKETEIPLELLVVYDLSDEVFATIDTGRNRTAGDVLSSSNIGGNGVIATAIRLILTVFQEKRPSVGEKKFKLSNTQVLNFFKENEQLLKYYEDRANEFKPKDGIITISKPQAIALMWILEKINVHFALNFVRELVIGNEELNGNLAIRVRDYIIKAKMQKIRMSPELIASLTAQYFPRYCKKENNETFIRLNSSNRLSHLLQIKK